jgi:hypothetical protein
MRKLFAFCFLLASSAGISFGQKIDYKEKTDSLLQVILQNYRVQENYIFLKYGEKELQDTVPWIYERELATSTKVFRTTICKEKKEGEVGKIEIIFGFKNSEIKANEIIYAYIRSEMNSKNWLIYIYEKGKLKQLRETYENGTLKETTPLEMTLETFFFVLRRINNTMKSR